MGWKLIEIEKATVKAEVGNTENLTHSFDHLLGLKLSEFSKRDLAIEVYSNFLSCKIWLCSNEEMATQIKKDDPETVCYTIDELRELIRLNPTPEDIKRVHEAKTMFSGSTVIESKVKEDSNESV